MGMSSGNAEMLRRAVEEARRCGLSENEISRAEAMLSSPHSSASAALQAAVACGDVNSLRMEIGAAELAGVPSKEISAATEHLRKLEWQKSVRREVETAIANSDPIKLKVALQHAQSAGITE